MPGFSDPSDTDSWIAPDRSAVIRSRARDTGPRQASVHCGANWACEIVQRDRIGPKEREYGVSETVDVVALAGPPERFRLVGMEVLETHLLVGAREGSLVGSRIRPVPIGLPRAVDAGRLAQRGADPVLGEPGGLVAPAEQLVELVRREAVIRVEQQLDCEEPLPDRQVRVVEDGARGEAEEVPTAAAVEARPVANHADRSPVAPRAADAVGPAQLLEIAPAVLFGLLTPAHRIRLDNHR